MTEFETFQKYFKAYQQLFGLNGYRVVFKYQPLNHSFSEIDIHQADMVATVVLNSKNPPIVKPFVNIHDSALHEALHLLCNRLEALAMYRHSSELEIYEAVEELVRKLATIVKEIEQ